MSLVFFLILFLSSFILFCLLSFFLVFFLSFLGSFLLVFLFFIFLHHHHLFYFYFFFFFLSSLISSSSLSSSVYLTCFSLACVCVKGFICMCLIVSLHLSRSIYLFTHFLSLPPMFPPLPLSLSIRLSVSLFLSASLFVNLYHSVGLSIFRFVLSSLCLSFHLCVCQSVVCLSVSIFIHPSLYPSIFHSLCTKLSIQTRISFLSINLPLSINLYFILSRPP